MGKGKVLVICGCTASGKSALAVECAKQLNTEIISADSMQIYTGMDVGTAKPTVDEMEGIPHRMIDMASAYRGRLIEAGQNTDYLRWYGVLYQFVAVQKSVWEFGRKS